jgi:hypothetical protein
VGCQFKDRNATNSSCLKALRAGPQIGLMQEVENEFLVKVTKQVKEKLKRVIESIDSLVALRASDLAGKAIS